LRGREKDRGLTKALASHGMSRRAILEERLQATALDDVRRKLVLGRIAADFGA